MHCPSAPAVPTPVRGLPAFQREPFVLLHGKGLADKAVPRRSADGDRSPSPVLPSARAHKQASESNLPASNTHCHGSAGRSGLRPDSSSDERLHPGSRMGHAPKKCPCHRDLRGNRLPRRVHGCCRRFRNGLSGSLPALSCPHDSGRTNRLPAGCPNNCCLV